MSSASSIEHALQQRVLAAMKSANSLLNLASVSDEMALLISAALNSAIASTGSIRAACEQADRIARTVGVPGRTSHAELHGEGWRLLPYGKLRPGDVYAVGALLAGRRAVSPNGTPVDAIDCIDLAFEAMFMAGRDGERVATERLEAGKRSENARKGGKLRKFSDEALLVAREQYITKHGKAHGWIKSVAIDLKVSEKAISDRWKELNFPK